MLKKQIISIDTMLDSMKNRIKPAWKIAFFATMAWGVVCHFVALIGNYPNHDALKRFYDASPVPLISLGRWFLFPARSLSSPFDMSWIAGMLTILYYCIIVILLVELFCVSSKAGIVCISGIIITFPVVASTFSHMFTADGYAIAFILAVLPVLLVEKYKWGFIFGAIPLALSLGTYQAYLSVTLVLGVFMLFRKIFSDISFRNYMKEIGKYLVLLALAFLLYWAAMQITLRMYGIVLRDYQGIDSLANPLSAIYKLQGHAKQAWNKTWEMFTDSIISGRLSKAYLIVALASCGVFIKKKAAYLKIWKVPFMVLQVAVIPFFLNSIAFFSGGEQVMLHLLTLSAYSFIFIIAVLLNEKQFDGNTGAILRWLSILLTFGLCIKFVMTSNIAYRNLQQTYEKTYGLCLRVVDRLEQQPEFDYDDPVAFLSSGYSFTPSALREAKNYSSYHIRDMHGMTSNINASTAERMEAFMLINLGVELNIVPGDEIKETEQYMNMPAWPSADCVAQIEDTWVVKFN